jgi:hypothetical protein
MEPTEAMIEAGAKALWDQDPHRIRWSELRDATKSMARIQARECLRAALVGMTDLAKDAGITKTVAGVNLWGDDGCLIDGGSIDIRKGDSLFVYHEET